ncbi:GPW/gp25 family protein [Algicola sagamiensis]|uniref:GPW/gp25 family protein n=1 Tax=Algicola sagamiensis TaxID=163869 RepID=UPI00036D4A6B|nr:GPW/gp25 family protein [Algicola sagamiensis]
MSQTEFIGQGWQFPPTFKSAKTGPQMATGESLLQQSIYLLLHTLVGERPLQPTFGCGLNNFLFQSGDPSILADLKEEIANTVLLGEPRITLLEIMFDSSELNEGILNIELEYEIKETNSRSNMVFPFYLNEKSI